MPQGVDRRSLDAGLEVVAFTKLKRWRENVGWTLEEVSGLTGYSVAMLSRAERGLRQLSARAKVRIARRLDVPLTELFDVEPLEDGELGEAEDRAELA